MSSTTRARTTRTGRSTPVALEPPAAQTPARQRPGAAAARSSGEGRPGIPLGRLLHVELRKLVDTRSGRWLLVTIGLLTALAVVLVLSFGPVEQLTFGTFLAATTTPQMLLLPVLGILTATCELSQRTALVTFAQEPRRGRVVAAKLLAVTVAGLVAVLLSVALAAGATLLAAVVKGASGALTVSWAAVGGTVLAELLSVWQGLAFGLLVGAPGAAIAAFFVVPTVMTLVLSLVTWLQGAAPWIDQAAASTPLLAGSMAARDWAHLASSHALWVLLPLLLGTWLLARREIR